MRAFIGVELAIPVVERLVVLQEELDQPIRQLGAQARWTPAEHIRLNLKVFPNLDPGVLPRVQDMLSRFCQALQPFPIVSRTVRFYPELDRPRLLLVEQSDERGVLPALREHIEKASDPLGFARDEAPWTPDIALGRVLAGGARPDLRGLLNQWQDAEWGETLCRELILYRTEMVGRRARVRLMRRFALGTGR